MGPPRAAAARQEGREVRLQPTEGSARALPAGHRVVDVADFGRDSYAAGLSSLAESRRGGAGEDRHADKTSVDLREIGLCALATTRMRSACVPPVIVPKKKGLSGDTWAKIFSQKRLNGLDAVAIITAVFRQPLWKALSLRHLACARGRTASSPLSVVRRRRWTEKSVCLVVE